MNKATWVSTKKLAGVVAATSMLLASVSANATVLTFDELPGNCCTNILNGYGGLQWNNFSTNNASPGAGYENGIVSGTNTAFNLNGQPASFSSTIAFSLSNAFFTGAWNDGLQIHVVAIGGSNTYTKDFTVDTSGPLNVFFNWSNLNSVSFSTDGGTPHPGYNGRGTHFAMDNLAINVSAVPEPETYAMLLAGLGFIGFMTRRRKELSI